MPACPNGRGYELGSTRCRYCWRWCRLFSNRLVFRRRLANIAATPIPKFGVKVEKARAIALTSPLPFLTCGVFAYVAARLGLHSVSGAVKLAFAVWLIGPLPLILTNAAFIKLHRVFFVSYAIGWLVKLGIVALAVGWFLR